MNMGRFVMFTGFLLPKNINLGAKITPSFIVVNLLGVKFTNILILNRFNTLQNLLSE